MRTKHEAIGSYQIGSATPVALEMILGTCVGVALYDSQNRVGGLHHIMLPDPVYSDQNPERYASSGLPLFIKALCEKGAAPENLEAHIAGGALVGYLNYHDFDLDIGGRTTERVMTILKHAHITVKDFTIWGITGCRLHLELPIMEVKINARIWDAPEHAQEDHSVDRDQVLATIAQLKSIPQIALRILRNHKNDDYALKDLADDLKQDQVLSAHTIKLANSALYKRRGQVDTIQGAVNLLGRDKIIKWVILKVIDDLLNLRHGGYSLCQGGLFHHARKTAQLSEAIACTTGKVDPNTAYLAGLLHDIGKVVLDQYLPKVASRLYQDMSGEGADFLNSEHKLLGMDHTEAGALLARQWGFPDELVEAIECHHRPGADDLRSSELVGLVHLADLLLARFEPGGSLSFPKSDQLLGQLQKINLSPQQLNVLIDQIPEGEHPIAA